MIRRILAVLTALTLFWALSAEAQYVHGSRGGCYKVTDFAYDLLAEQFPAASASAKALVLVEAKAGTTSETDDFLLARTK